MRRCKPRKPRPLIVTSIRSTGIACPWTLEGWTEDAFKISLRYRWGRLSIWLESPDDESYFKTIFQAEYGGEYSGSMDYWTLKDLTKGVIEWPLLCAGY